jgi:hypothetical protein
VAEEQQVALARLQEQLQGVREDVAEIVAEMGRSRTRLHNLEGFASAYLEAQKTNRAGEERQYRRLEMRKFSLLCSPPPRSLSRSSSPFSQPANRRNNAYRTDNAGES